ncbi:hypothetical protein Fmac_032670 [Flemingia macrophylla]|uniref:Uncharacterized protein n=1 Tax=Flemingia macrophylla TaxID=520843 RepID=A0ABD1L5M2_9FABA
MLKFVQNIFKQMSQEAGQKLEAKKEIALEVHTITRTCYELNNMYKLNLSTTKSSYSISPAQEQIHIFVCMHYIIKENEENHRRIII